MVTGTEFSHGSQVIMTKRKTNFSKVASGRRAADAFQRDLTSSDEERRKRILEMPDGSQVSHNRSLCGVLSKLLSPAGLLSLLGVFSVAFSLFGWGAATGISANLSLPIGTLVDSPSDALLLSWAGFVRILDVVVDQFVPFLQPNGWLRFWADAPWHIWLIPVGIAAIVTIVAWTWMRGGRGRSGSMNRGSWWKRLQIRLRQFSTSLSCLGVYLASLIAVLVTLPVLMSTVIILGVGFVATLPFLGVGTGQRFVDDWVVRPKTCVQVPNHSQRIELISKAREKHRRDVENTSNADVEFEPEKRATCVRVRAVKDEPGAIDVCGRAALTTSKFAILYQPSTGTVMQVPLAGARIMPVDERSCPAASLPAEAHQQPDVD